MSASERKEEFTRHVFSSMCEHKRNHCIGHCFAIAQRLSNQIESFAKVADANRQSRRYICDAHTIFFLVASERACTGQGRRRIEEHIVYPSNRKVRVRIPMRNSPAIILLKRQRSTGLGRAGAIDCLRRCIVISGRRPGLGVMIA